MVFPEPRNPVSRVTGTTAGVSVGISVSSVSQGVSIMYTGEIGRGVRGC